MGGEGAAPDLQDFITLLGEILWHADLPSHTSEKTWDELLNAELDL